LEVEAKFSVPDEQTFQQLLDTTSLAGFRLEDPSETDLYDRYLDTASGAFRAAGHACRLRQWDGQYLVTLKGLGSTSGAVHRREEHEVALDSPGPPQNWPVSSARDLALHLAAGEPLLPLFEIKQARHSRHLRDGPRAIAELNLDRVRLPRGNAVAAAYLELEAELLPEGNEQDLQQLILELQDRWGLVPEPRSKFERGLALLGLPPPSPEEAGTGRVTVLSSEEQPPAASAPELTPLPAVELLSAPGIQPDDPMSEAGRKTFRFHYRRMLYNEPGTRLGEDIEALHDMRVATRRMRAAFRVFGEYYQPKAVSPYLKGLKRTGRALGPVRDLDVFREKVRTYLSTLPESHQGSLDGFLAALETRREAARQRLLAYLDSDKYARFRERFGQFVETEGMGSRIFTLDGGEPHPYRVRHIAPVAVYERLAAVRAYDEWVRPARPDMPGPPLERLHALRIACKGLRYTLEFFREVLGPDSKAVIKEIVKMQDHLGNLQDAVVASGILRNYTQSGTWGHDEGIQALPAAVEDAPGVEAYLAVQQAEVHYLVDTFPQGWERIRGTQFSQMVAKVVAVL
jgi:CHAD domain-containing protein